MISKQPKKEPHGSGTYCLTDHPWRGALKKCMEDGNDRQEEWQMPSHWETQSLSECDNPRMPFVHLSLDGPEEIAAAAHGME